MSDFQNQSNDFLSLAICANSNHGVFVSDKSFFSEVNGFLVDANKEQLKLNILLLYRPKDMHPLLFRNSLENIMSTDEIEIILGDFSINFYDQTDSQHLRQIMDAAN